MAASWGGISFHMLADEKENTLARPMLLPEDFGVVRNKVPYANFEQVQFTGRGNARMEFKCEIYDEDDFSTLLARTAHGVSYELVTEWGDTISDILLMEMKDIWRVTFETEIHFTAVFESVNG